MSVKGTFIFANIDGKLFVGQSGLSYKEAHTMIEKSNKDDGNNSSFVKGRTNATMSVNSVVDYAAAVVEGKMNFNELKTAGRLGTPIPITVKEYTDEDADTVATGSYVISGMALISNISFDANDNDKNTCSFDLQFTGKLDSDNTDFASFMIAGQTSSTINTTNHTIAVLMPALSDVTVLVAKFSFAGAATCAIGATAQISGEKINDFTNPVTYAVTAADGTTSQNWTVTVTVAS